MFGQQLFAPVLSRVADNAQYASAAAGALRARMKNLSVLCINV